MEHNSCCISTEKYEMVLEALKGLVAQIPLYKLKIKKDFSLINHHAYALKVLHQVEAKL